MEAIRIREEELAKTRQNEEIVPDNWDNEAEGGEWITKENLYSYIAHGDTTVLNLIEQNPEPEVLEAIAETTDDKPKAIMDSDDDTPLTDLKDEDCKEDKITTSNEINTDIK